MDIEKIELPTEHFNTVKIDSIADFDGSIQLETTIKLSGEITINGIDYNSFINDFRKLLQQYQQ